MASGLPSDQGSAHAKVKEDAALLCKNCNTKAGEYAVSGIVKALQSPDQLSAQSLPVAFLKLQEFVKGDASATDLHLIGKVGCKGAGCTLLQFVPFYIKTFLIYVADVITALKLQKDIQAQEKPVKPFEAEVALIIQAHSVLDTTRCYSQEVIKATQPLR